MSKRTCHLQQPVSQSAFSVVNMSDDAKIPDSVRRELRQVNSLLKSRRKEACSLLLVIITVTHL